MGGLQYCNMLQIISDVLRNVSHNEGRGGGYGCDNNLLEVFGFLAFGLYILNLAMGMGGKRRKRSNTDICSPDFDPTSHPELISGVLAFYSMFEGFINANYESDDGQCRQFAVCVAAGEAADSGGPLGASLASALTVNIAARLAAKYQESEEDIMAAMDNG